MANNSYRLGRAVPFTPRSDVFQNSGAARETLTRMEEHLTANNVNLANTNLHVGAHLDIDPSAENFRNNAAANAMLTREYRKGFEVPTRF